MGTVLPAPSHPLSPTGTVPPVPFPPPGRFLRSHSSFVRHVLYASALLCCRRGNRGVSTGVTGKETRTKIRRIELPTQSRRSAPRWPPSSADRSAASPSETRSTSPLKAAFRLTAVWFCSKTPTTVTKDYAIRSALDQFGTPTPGVPFF